MRTFRRLFGLSALVLLPFASPGGATAAQGWRIDEAHTWIGFKVDAVGFPTTRGHFNHYSGKVLIDFDRPAKSFTSFTVDATSVDLGAQAFNDFVKSSPLLNAEKYPTLSFVSTLVEKLELSNCTCLRQSHYARRDQANCAYGKCRH